MTSASASSLHSVELGPVQETLLIPLLGRAVETQRRNGILSDPKAVSIVAELDYDFSRWSGASSLVGASVRTVMFDEAARNFLNQHPEGTIVEIGCGLNTRFERIDNGRARWFELDLPDTMALRQRYFEDSERRTMIAASVLDETWLDQVAATGGPWLFLSEAVLIYLDEDQVRTVVERLAARFPGAALFMDTCSRRMRDDQKRHDVMKTMPRESWFRWACDDPAALSQWGAELQASQTLFDAPKATRARLPLATRLVFDWAPFLVRQKLEAYRMNRFVLGPPKAPH